MAVPGSGLAARAQAPSEPMGGGASASNHERDGTLPACEARAGGLHFFSMRAPGPAPDIPKAADVPVRIGVSACLLGQNVRYDGGHKRDSFLMSFSPFVSWVPVCPEVEVGMGTPRESLRLERQGGETRMITLRSRTDHTAAMLAYSRRRVRTLEDENLSGYVLKKDSPSCGMERVRLYPEGGSPLRTGVGLFAGILLAHFPTLPVEEEGRLGDARLRENFVVRVFAYQRMRAFFSGRWTLGGLVAFHAAHKLLVMAHSPAAYGRLGRLVAGAKGRARADLRNEYEQALMTALATPATRPRHVNVLQHMAGYVSDRISSDARAELAQVIQDYGRGLLPLIVPVTLVKHHVRELGVAYLAGQVYLDPHPRELMLRNHV